MMSCLNSVYNITKQSKIFILSPHIDDACFSLGGILSNLKCRKTIWNVFSYTYYSKYGKNKDVMLQRKTEDKCFCETIDAKTIYTEYADAEARGYNCLSDYFGVPTQVAITENWDLIKEISQQIISRLGKDNVDIVFVPMAAGNHIDHLIVRQSAILAMCTLKKNSTIVFYEDLPYAVDTNKMELAKKEIQYYFKLKEQHAEISYKNKTKLIEIYRSQIFSRDIDLIIKYSKSIERGKSCERMWMLQEYN